MRRLSIGERQRVEILKVLMAGARLVILDEPTSVLAPQEVDSLFAGVEQLRAEGLSVVIITHKLRETRSIADRVTVLRGGKLILGAVPTASVSDPDLIEAMVGRRVPSLPAGRSAPLRRSAGRARARRRHRRGREGPPCARPRLAHRALPASSSASPGSPGNGQLALYEAILGLRSLSSGRIVVDGTPLPRHDPRAARDAGVVGVPEDPVDEAVVPGLDVAAHVALADLPALPARASASTGARSVATPRR